MKESRPYWGEGLVCYDQIQRYVIVLLYEQWLKHLCAHNVASAVYRCVFEAHAYLLTLCMHKNSTIQQLVLTCAHCTPFCCYAQIWCYTVCTDTRRPSFIERLLCIVMYHCYAQR
jgi:hypothetical protein